MRKFNNTHVIFIDGYLSALTDMDDNQGEHITRAFMKKSDDSKLQDFMKEKFIYMDNINLIKEMSYSNSIGLYYFLENMVLLNPCNFFKSSDNKQKICEQKDNHRRYVISHLMDYLDFAFEDAEIENAKREHIRISLLDHNKTSFIVLTIKRKNIELFLVFFKNNLNNKNFIQWFDMLIKHYEDKTKEHFSKKVAVDNDICENGLTVKVNRDIFEPLIKKAIEIGYFEEESKRTLLKYFSNKKITELEKVFCNK